jgi:hypothetical protein
MYNTSTYKYMYEEIKYLVKCCDRYQKTIYKAIVKLFLIENGKTGTYYFCLCFLLLVVTKNALAITFVNMSPLRTLKLTTKLYNF